MNDLEYNANGVKIVDNTTIERLVDESKKSPRKRAHLCLHTKKPDPIQRMIMALQPGAYVQPHSHENPDKRESFTIYQGEIAVVTFTNKGYVLESHQLGLDKIRTLELIPRMYHCLVVLKKDSVVFEVKDGPWESVETDKTFAKWAPSEGSEEAIEYLRILEERIRR